MIWGDWWNFRDVGINDMWYFHSSMGNITRAAHILGRKEVFTDPQSRQIFERILFETTPEGGALPYGASCGYNVVAGSRIVRFGACRGAIPATAATAGPRIA